MAGVRRGAFTCVGWQVTLRDRIWQVTSRSSEMGFPWRALSAFTFFCPVSVRLRFQLDAYCSVRPNNVYDSVAQLAVSIRTWCLSLMSLSRHGFPASNNKRRRHGVFHGGRLGETECDAERGRLHSTDCSDSRNRRRLQLSPSQHNPTTGTTTKPKRN